MRGALSLHQGPTVFPKQVSKYICHRYVCVQLGREMKQELLGTEDHCMLLLKCNATSAPCCMSLSDLYDQKSLLEPRGRLTTCSCLRCCRVTAPQQWEICVILLVFFSSFVDMSWIQHWKQNHAGTVLETWQCSLGEVKACPHLSLFSPFCSRAYLAP